MIRKTFILAAALAMAGALAYAQGTQETTKITGYLVDEMCATGEDEEAKEHATSCALMEACVKSGFVVVTGGKVYKLDEAGDKLALDVLKATKTKKGVSVNAEGRLEGNTLHVAKLEEAR